mmetsp:Transcript_13618/g.31910  ORF Transcript_13618/g.31910 Transcript_13618/m.31910 type:complete len:570 (+) Transcript_13618:78-1787(+)
MASIEKDLCTVKKSLIDVQDRADDNQHNVAALIPDTVDEDGTMSFVHANVPSAPFITNGYDTKEGCADHTNDGVTNTSLGRLAESIPVDVSGSKEIHLVFVNQNDEGQTTNPPPIERTQENINYSIISEDSSQSSATPGEIEHESSSASSSSSSSSPDRTTIHSTIERAQDDTGSTNINEDSPRSPGRKEGENEGDSSSALSTSSLSSSSSSSSDSSEESSLLSSWSEESGQDGEEPLPSTYISSRYEGLTRLEKKLELRKERLKRLCVGQPPAYVRLLENNEDVAGKIRIAEYIKEHPDECCDGNERNKSTIISPTGATISSLPGILQFELLHTLPCAYAFFMVCLGHTVFYSTVECICRIVYQSCLKLLVTESIFYGSLIVVGLLLQRINGGLFFYSSTTRGYLRIKMELSNRLKVGMRDARLFKHIKGTITDSSSNIFGYYLVSIGINHFYYKYNTEWMAQHSNWVEGIWSQATEMANAEFMEKNSEWERYSIPGSHTDETNEQVSLSCELAAEIVSPVIRRLYSFWCNDFTSEYKSVELTFHGVALLIVTGLTFRIGMNVIELCD